MLEESSFANRKADYFWLLLQSAVMLLVCSPRPPFYTFALTLRSAEDTFPAGKSPIPFLTPCLCPNLPLVPASPVHSHIPLWSRDYFRSLPPNRPCRSRLDGERHLESRSSGSSRMRSRSRRVVHEGCLDERDGRQTDDPERCPRCPVRFLSVCEFATDKCAASRKRFFGDI